MQTRQEANRKIIEILQVNVEKYPDMRFGQMLFNLDINQNHSGTTTIRDIYADESNNILERVKIQDEIFQKKNELSKKSLTIFLLMSLAACSTPAPLQDSEIPPTTSTPSTEEIKEIPEPGVDFTLEDEE